MEYDLIIRGGTVIDGSGSEPIKADIAVNAGRIARIGNLGDASASKTLDATGKMVTPGFVDLHTHLDTQIGWDPMMSSEFLSRHDCNDWQLSELLLRLAVPKTDAIWPN